jgi:Fe-S oxidoreductase
MLIDTNRIKINKSNQTFIYHDPCELGRGLDEYKNSRKVLKHIGKAQSSQYTKKRSLCCGGSLANIRMRSDQRRKITKDAYTKLTLKNPDFLITSCPRCEQTFSTVADRPVVDIAEFVEINME